MVSERIDLELGKMVWNKNLRAYKINELMHLNLFGKSFVIQCWIDVDEDEISFDEAFVAQRKAVLVILEHQEELARELEQKVLDYVNEELVANITYGEYDSISGEHCLPFSSLSSLGTVVESGTLKIPVVLDESIPVCFLFDLVDFDPGIGVGIEGYKVKEVATQYRFI